MYAIRSYYATSIFTKQVNVDANGLNIVGDAANEPSIAVDPTNPNSIVIGWRQFNTISSSFRQAGNGYTTNGGQTWTFVITSYSIHYTKLYDGTHGLPSTISSNSSSRRAVKSTDITSGKF